MTSALLASASQPDAWRAAFERALPDVELHVWPEAPPEVDFALLWKPPPEVFTRTRIAKAIFNLGAGADALLDVPTLPRDAIVVRLEDAGMAIQMAEFVTLAVLRAYREQDAYAAQQRERRWQPRARIDKRTFGVGVLGLGVLGRAVADALRPFGFPLYGWSASGRSVEAVQVFSGERGLVDVASRSKVLVVMLPLTSATRGIVDAALMAAMPRGAHLVNVARGGLVVESDLREALDAGQLASAALDVFEHEPLPAGHRFWHHPKIVITPHVSAATLVDESAQQVAAKLRAMLRGEAVSGVVDLRRAY
jgi:glyoxylate/hydroxypyruvate reductase A